MEHFEIRKNKAGDDIRIVWDTADISDEEANDINDHYINGVMTGIGEDGSKWEAWITLDRNDDTEWELITDPEQVQGPGTIKILSIVNNDAIYQNTWDNTGRITRTQKVYNQVKTADWFQQMLGKYPNVEDEKGPHYLYKMKLLEEPSRFLVSKMPSIDRGAKIELEQYEDEDSEFIKYENEKGKTLIRATDLGIAKWTLIKSNVFNSEIIRSGKHFQLKDYIIKHLF
jgi:hypothetical protein